MKFLISWPRPEGEDLIQYFEGAQKKSSEIAKRPYLHDKDLYAVPSFYHTLEKVLDDMGVPHDRLYRKRYKRIAAPNKDAVVLCYHAHSDIIENNVWYVHTSSLAGYFTVDRRGFAGFSEPAHNKSFFEESKGVDLDQAREFFDKFSKDFIESSSSRNFQPKEDLSIDEPYIFIAGQLSYDSVVTQLCHIRPPQEYYNEIAKVAKCKVVYKKHPADGLNNKKNDLKKPNYPNVIEYNGSIHKSYSRSAWRICN